MIMIDKYLLLFIIVLLINHNDRIALASPCPNDCNGKGRCIFPSRQCSCFEGFTGPDCSLKTCPYSYAWADPSIGVDKAHNLAECSNNGICDRFMGTCTCRSGFEGQACEKSSCPSACNGLGTCVSMQTYATQKDPGLGQVFTYENIWDSNKLYGCNCDSGYFGPDCSQRNCPTGDDPLTGNSISTVTNPAQYNEVQRMTCRANAGFYTLTFKGKTTVQLAFNAKAADVQTALNNLPTIGPGGVLVTVLGVPQTCSATGSTASIEFLQLFGTQPLLIQDTTNLRFVDGSAVQLLISRQTAGTKENEYCSNRGICDPGGGTCSCSTNYDSSNGYNALGTRADCGFARATIQFCPGVISCSAHGQCTGSPTYKCTCQDGWQGADCSQRICPKDVAWFTLPSENEVAHLNEYVECSNMGICDRSTGTCTCMSGFTGSKCEFWSCPGTPDLCSAHGQCLDMATLARNNKVNGVFPNPRFSYGLTPFNPATWDAFKIYGCQCDSGYQGYDCSEKTCPYGDDPATQNQLDERQVITCRDSDLAGSMILRYKEVDSVAISPTATTAQVQAALQGIPGIGVVAVENYNGNGINSICTAVGNQFSITFKIQHGDLPLVQILATNIDSVSIIEDIKGNKENIECSGRGLCDRINGKCSCFIGYTSSDGMNGPGKIADCGYISPVIMSAAA